MADNFEIKLRLDDGGLGSQIQQLTKVVENLNSKIIGTQKASDSLKKSQKQLVDTEEQLIQKNTKLNGLLTNLTSSRKAEVIALREKIIENNKERIAEEKAAIALKKKNKELIALAQQQEDARKTTADLTRQQERERIATIKGADAKRANAIELRKETQARKEELNLLKQSILARNGLSTAMKKTAKEQKALHFGIIDITNSGRLLNNSFAVLRSKLLLASFGFSLVAGSIGRNIQLFAQQEESVARLGLQFGSVGANELSSFASELQKVTRFGDENINSVMAQFGAYGANIEQTKLLTKATLDLAEGQNMDLQSASLLVSKAFGSSTNSLSRYGIELDSSSTKQEKINSIIEQSQAKYGGLAELIGELAGTKLIQAQNAFSDLREKMGEALAEGFNPIIQAITRLNEKLQGGPIRIFTELIIGLSAAFIGLQTVALGSKYFAAFAAASKVTGRFRRQQIAITGATVGAGKAIRVFGRTLLGATGGFGAFIAIGGIAFTVISELFGIFKKTKEETKKADENLNKYAGTIKDLKVDNATEQLEKLFNKLKEGNDLLRISISSIEFEAFFDDITKGFEKLPMEVFTEDANQLVSAFSKARQDLKVEFNRIKEQRKTLDTEIKVLQKNARLADTKEEREAARIRLKEAKSEIKELIKTETELRDKKESISQQMTSQSRQIVNITASNNEKLRENFKSLTGVSDEFIDKFIEGTGILEAIQNGTIVSTKDLTDVINENIKTKGSLRDMDEAEREALITEIALKNELSNVEKKLLDNLKRNKKFRELDFDVQMKQIAQLSNAIAAGIGVNSANRVEAARLQQFAATIDALAAANKALPNAVLAAAILAKGMANVAKIEAQLQKMNSSSKTQTFEQGGLVGGRRHSQGGTIIEAERGEFVMSRNAVESIGLETLNQLNQGGSSGNVVVNVSGNVMTQDFVEGELAESIKEAVRRGSDFGLS